MPGFSPRRPSPAGRAAADLPEFCDYLCPHADFAPADASGACRRDQAVYCRLFRAFHNKNQTCLGRLAPARKRRT
jgi:hypothetical protein